jgi:hypothetical protein
MVRVTQPARLVARLSRAVVGALGTRAFALASSNVWMLSDGMSWPRLLATTVFAAGAYRRRLASDRRGASERHAEGDDREHGRE